MITRMTPTRQKAEAADEDADEVTEGDWRQAIRESVRRPHQLDSTANPEAHGLFATRVPLAFAEQIDPADPGDPLLRQVKPSTDELTETQGFVSDPVGDLDAMAAPGVIHKYHGRVLLIATGACAINCRYCFRRHFPYGLATASANNWRAAIDYLTTQPEVTEIILSGGDPLVLPTAKLSQLTDQLDALPHIKRVRIHSRTLTAMPQRLDRQLLDWLGSISQRLVLVHHINHPRELGPKQRAALAQLRQLQLLQLNQSVLLAGVNDSVSILVKLSQHLFENGVLPYYLHLLDPVAGAAHFQVDLPLATELADAMRERLPGYLVPRLVRETAGEPSKTPVSN